MLLGGWTLLSVLPLATTTGIRMQLPYPTEITAAAIVISYWDTKTNPGVWITIFLVVIVFINLYAKPNGCASLIQLKIYLAVGSDIMARPNSGSH